MVYGQNHAHHFDALTPPPLLSRFFENAEQKVGACNILISPSCIVLPTILQSTSNSMSSMSYKEEENHGDSSSDGEFSDPLCVEVPSSTDDPLKLSGSSSDDKEEEAPLEKTFRTPTRKAKTTIQCFQQWLPFYVKFCSSAGNQDKLLKVLQWSLWLLANTATTARTSGKKSPNQRWMEFLSYEVSWARYVSRLLGFPMALEAAVNDSWTLDKSSKLYRAIGKILSYSMVAYHPLEALAYVQWRKPPPTNNDTTTPVKSKWHQPERWSYLSCRFWLAYVAAELVQCILQWRTLREQKRLLEQSNNKTEESLAQLNAQLSNTQLQTVRDALFLLPCLTWSLKNWDTKPLLKPHTVTTLMWAESIVCLYQAIRNQL
jgi:Peroxisomal biogenesis factor 11 (PEX11)